jgi:hypothetical protein
MVTDDLRAIQYVLSHAVTFYKPRFVGHLLGSALEEACSWVISSLGAGRSMTSENT